MSSSLLCTYFINRFQSNENLVKEVFMEMFTISHAFELSISCNFLYIFVFYYYSWVKILFHSPNNFIESTTRVWMEWLPFVMCISLIFFPLWSDTEKTINLTEICYSCIWQSSSYRRIFSHSPNVFKNNTFTSSTKYRSTNARRT